MGNHSKVKMALRINTAHLVIKHTQRLLALNLTRHFSITTNHANGDYADVVISGGGMVGAAMACALG